MGTNNTLNQSKLEVNTSNCCHTWEKNTLEQVTLGFGFMSDWLRKWQMFLTYHSLKESKPKANTNNLHYTIESSSIVSFPFAVPIFV